MQPWKIDLLLLHNFIDSMIYFVTQVQYQIGTYFCFCLDNWIILHGFEGQVITSLKWFLNWVIRLLVIDIFYVGWI